MRPGIIQDLVERDTREIGELHLDDWPHPFEGRADGRANHRVLADRRVQNAPWKSFRQSFRRLKRATEFSGNVLAVDENALIFLEKVGLRLANGFEVGNAHDIFKPVDRRVRESRARTNLLRSPAADLPAARWPSLHRLRRRFPRAFPAMRRDRGNLARA